MAKCPYCKIAHVYNTLFCSECGEYMSEDTFPETDRVDDIHWNGKHTPENGGTSSLFLPEIGPVILQLNIDMVKQKIKVPLNKAIYIGRVDPTINAFPDVDLTHTGAANSISRRHARILRRGNSVLVEDSGSFNGTFVNGKKLDPYLPERLNDGDTLQLGDVLIEVELS